jgi:hypothetical protein
MTAAKKMQKRDRYLEYPWAAVAPGEFGLEKKFAESRATMSLGAVPPSPLTGSVPIQPLASAPATPANLHGPLQSWQVLIVLGWEVGNQFHRSIHLF